MRAKDIISLVYRMLVGVRPPRPGWLPPGEWDDRFIASREFLSTWQWSKIRYARLQISKKRCVCCGKGPDDLHEDGMPVKLNVDHIWPRTSHPQLCLTLGNTQILCGLCNKGKGNSRPR